MLIAQNVPLRAKQKQFDRKFSKYGKRSMESLSSNAKVNALVYDYLKRNGCEKVA